MLPIDTEQIATAGLRRQDSPHEGFCSPSQTLYSPKGQEEFNVAQAEHPVSQTFRNTTQHFISVGLLLPSSIQSRPRVTERYTCSVKTRPRKHTHLSLIYTHVSHTKDRLRGHK